ncbi:MAG TPA: VWA domain-containing protein, partial [Pyrinomonadaceae bacterium]|nr:VWA domain-containing protein [Pyrinomonadaceae bacterium]
TGTDSPFSLILLIDTSYSTVFKASQIKEAAGRFIDLLGPQDQVAIVAFDQKPRILCKLTSNRRALEIALDAIETGSGTSLYDAIRLSVYNLLGGSRGKKAIVLLTDGVDTTSGITNAARVLQSVNEEDATVYVLSYPTFKDVQKLAKKDAEIVYDEDDNRRIVFNPPAKGERAEDYLKGEKFLKQLATSTGGELYEIKSQTDLGTAFARVADELRKTYLIGYYPSVNRTAGTQYRITIRINRPNLKISVRDKAVLRESNPDNKIN